MPTGMRTGLDEEFGARSTGDVSDFALAAFEDCDHLRIAAVHVVTELQLARIIHEGRLVRQMRPG